jgi:hypothetical protein
VWQGDNGPAKLEKAGQGSELFSPLFVPTNFDGDFDCSSFALLVWASSGIFIENTKIPIIATSICLSMK